MSGIWLFGLLCVAVLFIVFSTHKLKLHPFFALIIVAYAVGLSGGLSIDQTLNALTTGFGDTLGSIGIIIAAGAVIGSLLKGSGGTYVIANVIVDVVGKARSAMAMSITGAIVSIPVYCDSAYIILSSLNKTLAKKTNSSLSLYAVALSMGLYTTHVFIPPTPGPIAGAETLNAEISTVIILGLIVTIPVLIVTYLFATYQGSRIYIDPESSHLADTGNDRLSEFTSGKDVKNLPSPLMAFLPIIAPIGLIALQSIAQLEAKPFGEGILAAVVNFTGEPNTALIIGALLALMTYLSVTFKKYDEFITEGLKSAGTIILITGAGGALGSILRAMEIGGFLENSLAHWDAGILLPFIIAAFIKTAQGSSTVAIITTASIVAPLLAELGLIDGFGPALVTLAIGAGAMTVSHVNDSYFWIVSEFSGMDVTQAYKLQTLGSAIAGITGIIVIYIINLVLN
jgi:GntP family gluconate:H+ symporter